MKKMLLMAGVVLLGAVACKKDDDNGGSNPTTNNKSQMVALWNGESVTQKVIVSGQALIDTTFSVSGFTLNFMNDDKLVLSDGVDTDTLAWQYVNNTTIKIEGLFSDTVDTYQVLTLDNNNFDIKTSFQEEVLPGVFGTIEGTLRMNK